MEQKQIIIIAAVAVVVIVIAAALLLLTPPAAEQYTCPDGTVVASPDQCPAGDENPPIPTGEGEEAGPPSLPF